jgi:hypothetical protein
VGCRSLKWRHSWVVLRMRCAPRLTQLDTRNLQVLSISWQVGLADAQRESVAIRNPKRPRDRSDFLIDIVAALARSPLGFKVAAPCTRHRARQRTWNKIMHCKRLLKCPNKRFLTRPTGHCTSSPGASYGLLEGFPEGPLRGPGPQPPPTSQPVGCHHTLGALL